MYMNIAWHGGAHPSIDVGSVLHHFAKKIKITNEV
jgi:hypothetical protein